MAASATAAAAASNPSPAGLAARSLDFAARAACEDVLRYAFGTAEVLAEDVGQAAIQKDLPPAAVDLVAEAVRFELVPWALGRADGVRERVEARGGPP